MGTKRCSICRETKPHCEFHKNRSRPDGITAWCKDCSNKKNREYNRKNRDARNAARERWLAKNPDYYRKWERKNRDVLNKRSAERKRKRRATNPVANLRHRCRSRIFAAFATGGYKKRSTTQELVGCSFDFLREHIEAQFKPGMSWENKGEWHIDHIIPLASAKSEEEVMSLCHYTNLQPLWAEENIAKGDKVDFGLCGVSSESQ